MRTAFLHGKRAAMALIALVLFVIYAMRRDLYLEETNLPLGWESLETYLSENKLHSNATSTNSSIFSESFLNQEQRQELPQWMQNYFSWHRAMREAFPGNTILTHPRAPKILVWTGWNGMTDRLRGFTFPFYMANQTQRMLFFQWRFPHPIEEFLVPTGVLDWSLPLSRRLWARLVFIAVPPLFPDLPDASRGELHDVFWDQVQDLSTTGANLDTKILKLQQYVFPNDPALIELLQQAGDIKPIMIGTNSYGVLWRALFQPSPRLQRYIDQIRNQLGLTTRPYNAVHVRSRYPNDNLTKAARIDDHNQHDDSYYSIESDTHGLNFRGATKQYAIDVALHALQCAHSRFYTGATSTADNTTSTSTQSDPIYFFSDSNHLSHYLANVNSTYNKKDPVDQRVRSFLSRLQLTVLTRPDAKTLPSLHLGHGAYRPKRYFPAFADLYIAMGAKCIAWGTGGYGRFPMELSNTQCQVQHRTSGGPTPCP